MKILINGKLAALKENTSFEYIADNRLFSGSDGYSLTITFRSVVALRTSPSSATSTVPTWRQTR